MKKTKVSSSKVAQCVSLVHNVSVDHDVELRTIYNTIQNGMPQLPAPVNEAIQRLLGPFSALVLERLQRAMRRCITLQMTLEALRCHVSVHLRSTLSRSLIILRRKMASTAATSRSIRYRHNCVPSWVLTQGGDKAARGSQSERQLTNVIGCQKLAIIS
jgi:hypothetical protein